MNKRTEDKSNSINNIGSVIYTKTNNGITAEWVFSKNDKITRGTGIGKRLTELKLKNKFEGEYEIVYTDINGIKSKKLKLVILSEVGYYNLRWSYNEKTKFIGIGIENDNKLSVGWNQIENTPKNKNCYLRSLLRKVLPTKEGSLN